jgi:Putative prokaryotic signal transducing protein
MSRWVHLATAPDQLTAEMWVSILRDAGLSAMIRPSDAVSFLGVSAYGCRVQVVEEHLEEARQLLAGEIDGLTKDD